MAFLRILLLMVMIFPAGAERLECMVVLGDSITDGYTYGQLLMQAFDEAGQSVPAVICAGVAGNNAVQMAARLEESVLSFKPDLVTLLVGTNDANQGVSPEIYEAAVRQIVKRTIEHGSRLILLTPPVMLGERKEGVQERLDAYEAIIRKIASEHQLPVGENRALMEEAVGRGDTIMVEDGVHPNYLGQCLIARSILDAMGLADLPLPDTFQPKLFPGIVPAWRMRLAPLMEDGKPRRLTADTVAALQPDEAWVSYHLPDPETAESPGDWREQIRRNGFGTRLQELVGDGVIQAVATVSTAAPGTWYLHTGGSIVTVWVNGEKVHDQGGAWTGFHAGKERLPVQLEPGDQTIVLELKGRDFFLSMYEQRIWEADLYQQEVVE